MIRFILPFALVFSLASCNVHKIDNPSGEEPSESKYEYTYEEDDSNFCNPERGLYAPTIKYLRWGKIPEPSSTAALRNLRKSGKTFSYSEFYCHDYVFKDFDEPALQLFRAQFENHRKSGVKTIVRFAYSDGMEQKDKPWDAPCEQTLRHVEQLAPIFKEYEDVIYVVQYGFVGSWGEGYYTDYYGMDPKTDEDYMSRRTLMKALLKAVPDGRQVAVRYPMYKRGILGMQLADTINVNTAFGTSDIARVAAFNDCFVSGGNDVGTYNAKGDREMWERETNYVSMGGETCAVTNYCKCDNTYANLKRFHWTYLNEAYHKGVYNVWKEGACFEDIVKRLGYRFVIDGVNLDGDFKAGGEIKATVALTNKGFASIINKRTMYWVIENSTDASERYVIRAAKDPREWKGSTSYIYNENISLPPTLKSGTSYKIAIYLPDEAKTLAGDPEFSIRFANKNIFEEKSGLNVLALKKAE